MKKLIAIALFLPALALAQSGSFGGGPIFPVNPPAPEPIPPKHTNTWRGSGEGRSPMSRLEACRLAREDGNRKIQAKSYELRNFRISGSGMGDCMCEGPTAGGWYTCMVDISVTHSNR